jgi:hypothetical protein
MMVVYNYSTMASYIQPSISMLYNTFVYNKQKDKIDMILEPLQSMLQLALLSICPVGTKLRIKENILYIQMPNIAQPFVRWYNADKKDDLYFLYAVIKRFITWYNSSLNSKSIMSQELYQLIIMMSIEGLNNLFKTYTASDSNTVIHVIQMYKNLLEYNNDKIMIEDYIVDGDKNKINIDEVFEKIITIYDENILEVIYYSLLQAQAETEFNHKNNIIDGLNMMLNKYNLIIKEWIQLNLVL